MAGDVDRPDHADETLRRALEALPSASLITDTEQRILYANRAMEEMTGFRRADLIGKVLGRLQGPRTDLAAVEAINARLAEGDGFRGEILSYRADGEPFWNRLAINPVRDARGTVTHFVGTLLDVTAELAGRQSAADQRDTAELLLSVAARLATATARGTIARTIAESITELGFERSAVALLDDTRTGLRMAAVSGWPPELAAVIDFTTTAEEYPEIADVLTRPRQVLVTGRNASERARAELAQYEMSGYLITPVTTESAPHGLLVAYWASVPPPAEVPKLLAERLSGIAGLAAVALDHVQLIERIRREVDEDPLTRLATRSALERALVAGLSRSGSTTGIVYGDLDHFKRVNDSFGHAGGDELLRQVAERIKAVSRPIDTLARPGGDEFVALLPDVSDDSEVERFVERIHQSLQAPFRIGGKELYATISLGWSTSPPTEPALPDEAAVALLKAADSRMYQAKQRRRSRLIPDAARDSIAVDTDLHSAVENGEISAYFQPQYDARTGRLSGYEALARWHHRELGAVSPTVFIPLAEDNGLIHRLGSQILEQACRFADEASAQHGEPFTMQVNVSTRQLAQPGFADSVLAELVQWSRRTWELRLEVTESTLIVDLSQVQNTLVELRAHGIGIAIDDFGSGYSSLSQLQELPVNELKIDKAFIHREGAVGVSLTRAIIALGRSLDLEIVAEGIETRNQLDTLRRLGCDRLQGFLLAPPLVAASALSAPRTIDEALRVADDQP